MHRWVVLLALVACAPTEPPEPTAPPIAWVYPPPPGAFPLGPARGRLGRGQAPQPMVELGIADAAPTAPPRGPLRLATVWAIPGDGPARAVVYGSDGDHPATELIELDRGRVAWRDATTCAAPIVGVTAEAIVCADADGTRAVGLDGAPRWTVRSPFLAFTDDRVVVSAGDAAVVLDAATGGELARVKLPAGVESDAILASCGDAGRELYATGRDGRLVRVAEAKGGPAIQWSATLDAPVGAGLPGGSAARAPRVATSAGGPGVATSAGGPRVATSAGGPGVATSAGGPRVATSAGGPGVATSAGGPGGATSAGGPRVATSAGGPRVATSAGGPRVALDGRPPASSAAEGQRVASIDACDAAIVVTLTGAAGRSLVAIARDTGALTGRIDGVRGAWPARDGSERIEIATAHGVASYPRDLAGPAIALELPPLGALIASRGDRRLVRATPLTAVLLDRAGVRAYLPLGALGGALGDDVLLATSWAGAPGETVHRFALPPRARRALRIATARAGVMLDAELRDLPDLRPLALGAAIAQPDTAMHGVAGHALDPGDGGAVYAIALDRRSGGDPAESTAGGTDRAGVARADLATRRWRWQRVDGCGAGAPVGLAVARDVVVCGTDGAPELEMRAPDPAPTRWPRLVSDEPAPVPPQRAPGAGLRALVRATSRDGAAAWDWPTTHLDGVAAGGDVVVVRDAAQLTVLDARTGRVAGHVTSDDAGAARVAVVALAEATLVVTAERGRVVARLAAGLWPVWSIEVAGVVRALAASGDGVLVALEDGDAYRIDARTAAVTALPGLGLTWHADGDVVAGHTTGGPIPGPEVPTPPPTAAQLLRRPLQIAKLDIDTPPPMSTPLPPSPPLGDSWQLTLYELAGGLRARNDYALLPPIAAPAMRGPAGSPLVVAYGPGLRAVVVLDPRTGDPLRRVQLPEDAAPAAVFGTVVDGSPVAGAVLGAPLRVVLF